MIIVFLAILLLIKFKLMGPLMLILFFFKMLIRSFPTGWTDKCLFIADGDKFDIPWLYNDNLLMFRLPINAIFLFSGEWKAKDGILIFKPLNEGIDNWRDMESNFLAPNEFVFVVLN